MFQERFERYRDRVRREFTAAFREEHTPHEVAASFTIGVFVTSMPTGGLGIGLFFVFAYWLSWISKPAIFASVAVLNPFVKPIVYLGSLQLGAFVLGTGGLLPDESTATESSIAFVQQLVVGNLLIALTLAAIGYVVVLQLMYAHRRRANSERDSTLILIVLALIGRR